MSTVSLSNVFKRYGTSSSPVTAVRDLSLEIRDKEFMVLVGPSGCGKTTALRMIAGLEEISDGTISIDQRVVNDVEPRDRDIAMVFQNYALYPHMSVYENMAFGLRLRNFPKDQIDTRVKQAADQLGLTDMLQRKPGQLSGGQRQRVALGRAIVREPKVFLMDEPLSNLDAKLRIQTRAELIKLHRRLGITTIYVTHDQVEAMTMGERMAVMKDGVLQQCDTPMNIYNNPANIFVAGFVGTPSMNFIDANLIKSATGYSLDSGEGINIPVASRSGSDESLSAYAGKPVTVGIRPGDIEYKNGATDPSRAISTTVDVVEPMGDVSTLYLTVNGGKHQLIASLDGETGANVKEGDQLNVSIEPDRIHVFDKATELALT
jgi:multiple sugar transport system ATP-binding protein